MDISVNFIAVLVAAVASFLFGWLWHGPLFGKKWMSLEGFTPESMKSMKMTAGTAMTFGFVSMFLTAWVLGWLSGALAMSGTGIMGALQLAFWPWLGLTMPTLAHKWLWEGKSFSLFTFNAIYGFASLLVMALVFTLWA